ncbi:SRPBCC domain-containing protein [Elizabethkingia meningoseptica]|uniref:SRPBCC family protein n=1 Tax=Elizabethkingia meningoseptica TaxID=238 RepID=UPI000841F108|nr:SRPBCC domain-containing protein [Elizabethkingia meningoseptica]MDE5429850.1 SRPBCC domain-containing protein [Elizabethkingia meningoseptica]MDE5436785.1 SRPBCC domain-containing protein [Elizabethkingia meningoseptica]MDE5491423.1 SRPBCC domain-containing protein [Elizabethkingia meningoseptica]MDE5509189.1 SRPBCC domain-containing protein [Elizabethkingia meningoseptica]MDE5514706.1 SRPBCC domain-containing protein [Elizabethkingia meningoseptica]
MKNNLFFNFSVDKENNAIVIKREFDADPDLLWQSWTKAELLDKWWAPKPYHVETKTLNFTEGGVWLYAMVSPENEKHWCKANYTSIEPQQSIAWRDSFCDENGNENKIKPHSYWTINFSPENNTTILDIILKHDHYAAIETILEMGFKEGFTMCMQNLDELLPALKK